ncbi:MAG: AAA family ATPase, partial [Methanomassiliicoccales archaeon]
TMKRMALGSGRVKEVRPRHAFKEVMRSVEGYMKGGEHMLLISGIRGAGKSTLMAQTYQELLSRGFAANRMVCVSMDEAKLAVGASVEEIFQAVQVIIPEDFLSMKKRDVILFLDEVQYDDEWSLALKVIYDRAPDLFLLCTGSSALHLQEQGDLARRGRFLELPPLGLSEYLELLNLGAYDAKTAEDLADALFNSDDASECYERLMKVASPGSGSDVNPGVLVKYLTQGSLPIFLQEDDPQELKNKYIQLLEKVVFMDMPGICSFDRETSVKISQMTYLLADSDRISYEKIGKTVELSKGTITPAFRGLERAGIIVTLRGRGGEYARVRSAPRYKFSAPAMHAAMLGRMGREIESPAVYGALFEDAAVSRMNLLVKSGFLLDLWYESHEGSVDLVVRSKDRKQISIELGWGRKDSRQSRTGGDACKYNLVASSTHLQRKDDVVFVPREYILLAGLGTESDRS